MWKFWKKSYSPLCKEILRLLECPDDWYVDFIGRNGTAFVSLPKEGLRIFLNTLHTGWKLEDVKIINTSNYNDPMDITYESVMSELSKREQKEIRRRAIPIMELVQNREALYKYKIQRLKAQKTVRSFLRRKE